MAPLRIGIIGVGGFGLYCMQQYLQMEEVTVTAIAGTHPEKYARLAAEYQIPFHTTDWRELVTHPEVDIVYLATPPYLHAEQGVAAANAGKHVFCEKPLALTLGEADAMLAAADRHQVRVGINFVMRYSALYDIARAVAIQGEFGRPQHLVFENYAGDLPHGHWFWDPAKSGGIPVEHGVHFFDIFASILGDGTLRCAANTRREDGVADKWSMLLQYGPQVLGSFYHAFDAPSVIERTWAVLCFERGYLRLDGWIPERLEVDGVCNSAEVENLRLHIPTITALPLEAGKGRVLANGHEVEASHRVIGVYSPGTKDEIYKAAVRDAMRDFAAWVANPDYRPRVTGLEARTALAVALEAERLAGDAGQA